MELFRTSVKNLLLSLKDKLDNIGRNRKSVALFPKDKASDIYLLEIMPEMIRSTFLYFPQIFLLSILYDDNIIVFKGQ
jgi:hypothetical protein